jgi:hypothetical protein
MYDLTSSFVGVPGVASGTIKVIGVGPQDGDFSKRHPKPKSRSTVSANPLTKCDGCGSPKGRLNVWRVGTNVAGKAIRMCRSCILGVPAEARDMILAKRGTTPVNRPRVKRTDRIAAVAPITPGTCGRSIPSGTCNRLPGHSDRNGGCRLTLSRVRGAA